MTTPVPSRRTGGIPRLDSAGNGKSVIMLSIPPSKPMCMTWTYTSTNPSSMNYMPRVAGSFVTSVLARGKIGGLIRINFHPKCLARIMRAGRVKNGWIFVRSINSRRSCLPALTYASPKASMPLNRTTWKSTTTIPGFPLTYQDQLQYALWLADEAHKRGLAIGVKNAPTR